MTAALLDAPHHAHWTQEGTMATSTSTAALPAQTRALAQALGAASLALAPVGAVPTVRDILRPLVHERYELLRLAADLLTDPDASVRAVSGWHRRRADMLCYAIAIEKDAIRRGELAGVTR